jgi:hypothetical protein
MTSTANDTTMQGPSRENDVPYGALQGSIRDKDPALQGQIHVMKPPCQGQ